ncbi:MAG: AAA family ATPase [Quisquiliibacterium sp.]
MVCMPARMPWRFAAASAARVAVGMGLAGTVAWLAGLACLLALDPDSRIALAAPTGKAAARMIDAIRQSAQSLPAQIRDRLPAQATTIHRLLGVQADNNRFRHRIDNPLPVDLVVVDEASMLDLSLAVHLFEAVPTHARLMLLGDKDQLAAVESGAVFADLSCNPEMSASMREQVGALAAINPQLIQPAAGIQSFGLSDLAVWFTRSYRFAGRKHQPHRFRRCHSDPAHRTQRSLALDRR